MADTENSERPEADAVNNEIPAAEENAPFISEREKYCNSLRLWIHQAQLYQNFSNCFPYYMMTFQGLQNNHSNVPLLNNNYQFQGQQFPFQFPFIQRPVLPNQQQDAHINPADVINRHGGYEYAIPSLHKRIIAEFIDFVVLFVFKLFVTLVAVDVFDIILKSMGLRRSNLRRANNDITKFDIYKFSENYEDYKYAIDLTTEILYFELVFKLFICIFEAFCLSSNYLRVGGATPGKSLMGLRVVTATAVVQVEGRPRETVLLYPGTPVTFRTALIRSLIKNLLISLLFPICVILFVFRFNRTGYDLLCGVIVVEENMYPPRRHAP